MNLLDALILIFRVSCVLALLSVVITFGMFVWAVVQLFKGGDDPQDLEETPEQDDYEWTCIVCYRRFSSSIGLEHPEKHYNYHHRYSPLGLEDSRLWKS